MTEVFNSVAQRQDGRFNRLDDFAGSVQTSLSRYKSEYVHGDPINGVDPGGDNGLTGLTRAFESDSPKDALELVRVLELQ